jgi:hypothetical protein
VSSRSLGQYGSLQKVCEAHIRLGGGVRDFLTALKDRRIPSNVARMRRLKLMSKSIRLMNQLPDPQKLTATVARSFAWLSLAVTVAAGVVWGTALYDMFVGEWTRLGIIAFCAVGLSITAYSLARTAVSSIG